ncbi:MAG TPA: hemerythrin domain-containing protein [Kofleriaceae bacterium]|nr:hemerythrin domain-containing protein [Kofleriaceae bacterium]
MPTMPMTSTSHRTPSQALAELSRQHAELRAQMERCEDLADELDADKIAPSKLLREVARLRRAFDEHNQFEEELLRPVLLDTEWLGAVRVSHMMEEHVREHRSMRKQLGTAATSELRAVIANLRAHLEDEERYFLSHRVLRDDLAG